MGGEMPCRAAGTGAKSVEGDVLAGAKSEVGQKECKCRANMKACMWTSTPGKLVRYAAALGGTMELEVASCSS